MFRRIRVHPMVRGTGVFLFRRADVSQMFGSCYVIRTAAMQVAIHIGLFVQREGIAAAQHLRDHPLIFRFRSVAIHHVVRLGQLRRFVDPGFQWSRHSDLPTGPIFLHNTDQSERLVACSAGDTLEEDPDQVGVLERLDSARQQSHSKTGTSGPADTLSATRHSPCYASPPAQVGCLLVLPCCKLVILSTNSESDRLRVVLVAPRNPLNIGAAARAMTNFAFFHLRLVNPYELPFRETRSAVS